MTVMRRAASRNGGDDLAGDELVHLRLLGQISIRRIRHLATLGPFPDVFHIDIDHRSHIRTVLPYRHRFLNVRTKLELILDKLRRKLRAVGERSDIFSPVDDHQLTIGVKERGVPRVQPAISDGTDRGLRVFVVPQKDAGTAYNDFSILGEFELDVGKRSTNCAQGHLLVTLDTRDPAFGLAIDLFQVDPEGAEEQKHLRPQGCATRIRRTDTPKPEVIAQWLARTLPAKN